MVKDNARHFSVCRRNQFEFYEAMEKFRRQASESREVGARPAQPYCYPRRAARWFVPQPAFAKRTRWLWLFYPRRMALDSSSGGEQLVICCVTTGSIAVFTGAGPRGGGRGQRTAVHHVHPGTLRRMSWLRAKNKASPSSGAIGGGTQGKPWGRSSRRSPTAPSCMRCFTGASNCPRHSARVMAPLDAVPDARIVARAIHADVGRMPVEGFASRPITASSGGRMAANRSSSAPHLFRRW